MGRVNLRSVSQRGSASTATSNAELDEIESLANDRVTVLDAVEARRAEVPA